MPFIVPVWPRAPGSVRALSTTRRGGVSAGPYGDGQGGGGLNLGSHVGDDPGCVAANRARVAARLPAAPVWLSQVHGTAVADAATAAPETVPRADAAVAHGPGAVCAVMTADCLPVLLCDAAGTVVGAAHAGWRGLAAGVLERTVAAMRSRGAGEIIAWLGPAIGPAHFEVGADVRAAFAGLGGAERAFRAGRADRLMADIYLLARLALERAGVADVSGGDRCTVSEADSFYSYRRDGVTGRMASLIWLDESR